MVTNDLSNLHDLEQRTLELMLFVAAQKAEIKQAKKEIEELLKQIEILKNEQ